jgi:type IV pilus assembly protein PilZ
MNTPSAPKTASPGRPSVLQLNIASKGALYASYMSFLKNGGLFIPTAKPYALGDDVYMLLQLMNDPTRHPVAGTVVWITPAGALGGKQQGVGIHFAEDDSSKLVRAQIEQVLAGHLSSSRPTHTL